MVTPEGWDWRCFLGGALWIQVHSLPQAFGTVERQAQLLWPANEKKLVEACEKSLLGMTSAGTGPF